MGAVRACGCSTTPDVFALKLRATVKQNGASAAYVCTSDGLMPVCCLISRDLRDDLRQALADGAQRHCLAASTMLRRSAEQWPREY